MNSIEQLNASLDKNKNLNEVTKNNIRVFYLEFSDLLRKLECKEVNLDRFIENMQDFKLDISSEKVNIEQYDKQTNTLFLNRFTSSANIARLELENKIELEQYLNEVVKPKLYRGLIHCATTKKGEVDAYPAIKSIVVERICELMGVGEVL